MEENATHAQAELSRLIDEGYATRYPNWDAVRRRWGEVAVSKLACIVKEKDDKTVKVRIIIDFLRSHVNKAVKMQERAVLPRLKDVALDLIDLIEKGGLDEAERPLELLAVDFKDAFHMLPAHLDELPFQIAKGVNGEYIGYNTVVFGGSGSPLIWARAAALLGRSGMAVAGESATRIQIYVDDPLLGFKGSRLVRETSMARVLVWWLSLGPRVSWSKFARGGKVRWIGADISIEEEGRVLVNIPEKYALDMGTEAEDIATKNTVSVRRLRRLAGRGAWAAGIVPAFGAMLAPLWAVIAGAPTDCEVASEALVPTVQIRHSLLWLAAFARRARGTLTREFVAGQYREPHALRITTDASPWGYGAVLEWWDQPIAYISEPISNEDLLKFGIVAGDCRGQSLLETLALLIAVRAWLPRWQEKGLRIILRSDSKAAIGAVLKLRSRAPQINEVIREMALDLAEGKYAYDIIRHLPGKINKLADALSRRWEPGAASHVPSDLQRVEQTVVEARTTCWWEVAAAPS